jgi:hypothetical protein
LTDGDSSVEETAAAIRRFGSPTIEEDDCFSTVDGGRRLEVISRRRLSVGGVVIAAWTRRSVGGWIDGGTTWHVWSPFLLQDGMTDRFVRLLVALGFHDEPPEIPPPGHSLPDW